MKHFLSSALFAGVAAGLLGALLQFLLVQPDIILAERYESGELVHFQGVAGEVESASHDHEATEEAGHDDEQAAPEGGSDLQRNLLTVLFNILTFCGFGLILLAFLRMTEAMGHRVSREGAVLWGIGGFLAFQLAPALGLAPELPGTPAADLAARQYWWFATVVLTGFGLWLLAYGGATWQRIAGAGVLTLPHLWGAPEAEAMGGIVPPELAASFAAHSLGLGLVTWAILGLVAVTLWHKEPGA